MRIFKKDWNKKMFLAPESQLSMAAIHVKVYADDRQEYQARISDCNNTIKIWGKIDSADSYIEFKQKISSLKSALELLENHVDEAFLESCKINFFIPSI
jgi:hypothetical protein